MSQNDANQRGHERIISWRWSLIVLATAVASSAVAIIVLYSIAGHNASLRIEAIKTGLTVAAGAGGAAALVLAFRRQEVNERVARDTAYDATERRVTELYAKAVEQLGHDKAAVRLGGLYSLERLAQDHAEHRQTVTDVICAYLRMPFQPPPSTAPTATEPGTTPESPDLSADVDSDSKQELQVRLTAQNLLARHFRIPLQDGTTASSELHWHDIRIDLSGALLIDLDFSQCRLYHAQFERAQFNETAAFIDARFNGNATFGGAQFNEATEFFGAQFNEDVTFVTARFNETAAFVDARFNGSARFIDAQFNETAEFSQAQFNEHVTFVTARFNETAAFIDARFNGSTEFSGAQFNGDLSLSRAEVSLSGSQHVWPAGWHVELPSQGASVGFLTESARPG